RIDFKLDNFMVLDQDKDNRPDVILSVSYLNSLVFITILYEIRIYIQYIFYLYNLHHLLVIHDVSGYLFIICVCIMFHISSITVWMKILSGYICYDVYNQPNWIYKLVAFPQARIVYFTFIEEESPNQRPVVWGNRNSMEHLRFLVNLSEFDCVILEFLNLQDLSVYSAAICYNLQGATVELIFQWFHSGFIHIYFKQNALKFRERIIELVIYPYFIIIVSAIEPLSFILGII
ncbi:hypothetical protein ACJX0J_006676, partial [Zea mays]